MVDFTSSSERRSGALIFAFAHAACQALAEGNERISDIALNNGFYDLSHFNRQFKAQMAMSPSAYRKKYAGVKSPPLPWLASPNDKIGKVPRE